MDAKSGLNAERPSCYQLNFYSKSLVFCVVCVRAFSSRRITQSLAIPGQFYRLQKVYTRNYLHYQLRPFSKWVTKLICRSIFSVARVSRITRPWKLQPSILYMNRILNFNELGFFVWDLKIIYASSFFSMHAGSRCTWECIFTHLYTYLVLYSYIRTSRTLCTDYVTFACFWLREYIFIKSGFIKFNILHLPCNESAECPSKEYANFMYSESVFTLVLNWFYNTNFNSILTHFISIILTFY